MATNYDSNLIQGNTEFYENVIWSNYAAYGAVLSLGFEIPDTLSSNAVPNSTQTASSSDNSLTEKPLVVFLLDTSGYLQNEIAVLRHALKIFSETVISVLASRRGDPSPITPLEKEEYLRTVIDVHLIAFNSSVDVLYSSLDPNKQNWSQAITGLSANGETNYELGLSAALEIFNANPDVGSSRFRNAQRCGTLIILTGGVPNSGSLQTQAQIEAFRRENFSQQIKTFAIGLGNEYDADIVSSLGDEFFNISDLTQIHSIFSGICNEIYSFGYNARIELTGIPNNILQRYLQDPNPDYIFSVVGRFSLDSVSYCLTTHIGRLFFGRSVLFTIAFACCHQDDLDQLLLLKPSFKLYWNDVSSSLTHSKEFPFVIRKGESLPPYYENQYRLQSRRFLTEPERLCLPSYIREAYFHEQKVSILVSLSKVIHHPTKLNQQLEYSENRVAHRWPDPEATSAREEILTICKLLRNGEIGRVLKLIRQAQSSNRTQSALASTFEQTFTTPTYFSRSLNDAFSKYSTRLRSI